MPFDQRLSWCGAFRRPDLSTLTKGALLTLMAWLVLAAWPWAALANDNVRWRLHSAFETNNTVLGEQAGRLASRLDAVSAGKVQFKVFRPGAFASGAGYFDAVSQGRIEAAFGSPVWHGTRNPALLFFAGWPFGFDAQHYLGWMQDGGGAEAARAIYRRYNIHYMLCGLVPTVSDGWSLQQIDGVERLVDLPVIADGFEARLMQRLGARALPVDTIEFEASLESGEAIAVFAPLRMVGHTERLAGRMKNHYRRSWAAPVNGLELLINLDSWRALNRSQQMLINMACQEQVAMAIGHQVNVSRSINLVADNNEVSTMNMPADVVDSLWGAWESIVLELLATSEDAPLVWDTIKQFAAGENRGTDAGKAQN